MNTSAIQKILLTLLAGCIVSVSTGVASAQILKDDFESGTDNEVLPTNAPPWRINDSANAANGLTARYRSVNDPFPSGNRYAYLNDPEAATGVGFRLLSTAADDADGLVNQINDQLTTFSFEFYEPLPDSSTGTNPGLTVGYYYNQVTGTGQRPDLNSGGRIYYSALHNGLLSPGGGSATPVAYEKEKVNTLFMVANDTSTAVENYRDGHTLAAETADVWISLDGAAPIFAFTVPRANTATPERVPGGIGFRAFNNDIEEFLINNVLLVAGASFDRSAFAQVLGDYNGNGTVDAADYVVWRQNPVTLAGDATPASVGPEDYTYWASRFGATTNPPGSALGQAASVPEASCCALIFGATIIGSLGRQPRRIARIRVWAADDVA